MTALRKTERKGRKEMTKDTAWGHKMGREEL